MSFAVWRHRQPPVQRLRVVRRQSQSAAEFGPRKAKSYDVELTGFMGQSDPSAMEAQITWFPRTWWKALLLPLVFAKWYMFAGRKARRETFRVLRTTAGGGKHTVPVTDARHQQQAEGLSDEQWFNKYGFVLLKHESKMTAQDWEESDTSTSELYAVGDFQDKATPVRKIYSKEVEGLVKKLMPSALEIFQPTQGLRRVVGSSVASGRSTRTSVHSDYARAFEQVDPIYSNLGGDPNTAMPKQRERLEVLGASEHVLINLWRPIAPMCKPCRSRPLCFCDPNTVKEEDVVVTDLILDKDGAHKIFPSLKYSPDQKWYFYPDITPDEVIVFKQFDQLASESTGKMPVFHTAFDDPEAFKGMEGRVSFEYRVGIILE